MHVAVRRIAALVAAPALSLGALAALSAPAQAASDPAPAAKAAAWLATQVPSTGILTTAYVFEGETYDYEDFGLSIDVALALHAAGGQEAAVTTIADGVEDGIDKYTAPGFGTVVAAGATAKALTLAQAAGDGSSTYAADLKSQLESTVAQDDPIAGRLQDQLDPNEEFATDYANTIGQAFAAMSLDAAESPAIDHVTDFLLEQQCSAGYFRQAFAAPDAADQSCDGGSGQADVDATGLAVRALISQDNPANDAHIDAAVAWLKSVQRADGAFSAGSDIPTPNANSTGLAGYALALAGETGPAAKAATWIRSRQATNLPSCATFAAADSGALAYDAAARTAAQKKPLDVLSVDPFRRATAQALPVLAWAPAGSGKPKATYASGFVQAGKTTPLKVSGAAPGEALCLKSPGKATLVNATAQGTLTTSIATPTKTTVLKLSVVNAAGTVGSANLQVLGAKKVPFSLKAKVRLKRAQVVRVSGLAKGESVTVTYRGKKVASGKATSAGTFAKSFKVTKVGKAKVVVRGQFGNRTNSKTFTVVR